MMNKINAQTMEQINQVSENFRNLMQSLMEKAATAYAEGKLTAEECVRETDQDIDALKGAFFNTVETIGRLTGVTALRLDIARVFERGCNERTSKNDLYHMAKEIRAIVEERAEELEICFDADGAEMLRAAFHEGSIVEMFVKGIVWFVGKLWKKVKKLAGHVGLHITEDSILGVVCKGIGGLAHLVNAGAKVVFNAAKYTVSIIGAGALLIADYIWMGICWLFMQAKALWMKLKGMQIGAADEEEEFDEDFNDEEESFFEEEDNVEYTFVASNQ